MPSSPIPDEAVERVEAIYAAIFHDFGLPCADDHRRVLEVALPLLLAAERERLARGAEPILQDLAYAIKALADRKTSAVGREHHALPMATGALTALRSLLTGDTE